ncbi:MAG: hypothetical protein NTX50_27370 [Candidatus Sumerlaeota bacterium]|nr:hypothetical protein [Candidatus Sumerlaeota bacterium]
MKRVLGSYAAIALCAGAGFLSWGCRGWQGQSHGWGGGGEGGPGYQIESLRCDGRVYMVLAANGCSGGASSSGGGTSSGQLHAIDGRKIKWSCSTSDGTDGAVKVDGQRFDLRKGAVFLVSTKDKKTKVEQLAVDMSKLQGASGPQSAPMRGKLETLGNAAPRIAEFFKERIENGGSKT